MIIELLGLPGCGKSLVANELVKILKNKGYSVSTYKDFVRCGSLKKIFFHALVINEGREFLLKSTVFCIKNHLLLKADVYKRIVSCLVFIWFYKQKCSLTDYVIMDEGFAQGVVSALYIYNSQAVSFEKLVELLNLDITFVFLTSSAITSSKRIEKRNTKGHGRCDDISDSKERIGILEHQKNNFEQIYQDLQRNYKTIRINNEGILSETIENIRSLLSI